MPRLACAGRGSARRRGTARLSCSLKVGMTMEIIWEFRPREVCEGTPGRLAASRYTARRRSPASEQQRSRMMAAAIYLAGLGRRRNNNFKRYLALPGRRGCCRRSRRDWRRRWVAACANQRVHDQLPAVPAPPFASIAHKLEPCSHQPTSARRQPGGQRTEADGGRRYSQHQRRIFAAASRSAD